MSNTSPYQERELLQRLANNDAAAFKELLVRFQNICYRVAVDLLQDKHIAEDILQEAFLKVWLRRKQMPEVENFGGWLRAVTVNLVYDHITERRKERLKADNWLQELTESDNTNRQNQNEFSDFAELLARAVNLLSPRQRQVFELIKQQGYSREETAKSMNIGLETVKYHLDMAMKTIRAFCIHKIDPGIAGPLFLIIAWLLL